MTTIYVSALCSDRGRVLLVKNTAGAWELPTTSLGDGESTEEALRRLLADMLGVELKQEEFLDTFYEQTEAGSPAVRNVYVVRDLLGTPRLSDQRGHGARWLGPAELSEIEIDEAQRAILRDGLCAQPALPGAMITIVTGPAASGKTTVAARLCHRLERAAHIEVDLLRDMVIAGYASPVPADEHDPIAAAEQTRLATANAISLGRNFSLAGYEVAIDAVIETSEGLDELLAGFAGFAPVSVITLMPDAVTLQARDAIRDPDLRLGQRCLELRTIYETNGEQRGLRLDSSHMSVSATVSWILANRDRARVL